MSEVIIRRNGVEKEYAVMVAGDDDLEGQFDRIYQWGTFDDGDVSWQRARRDAGKYADEVRAKLAKRNSTK